MTTFPPHPIPPVFKGLTTKESQAWLAAHNWAYASIVGASRRIEDFHPLRSDIQYSFSNYSFSNWFGGIPTSLSRLPEKYRVEPEQEAYREMEKRRQMVLQSLNKMAKRMSETIIVYQRSDDVKGCLLDNLESRNAFTQVFPDGSDGVIHLCPKSFNVHKLRIAFQDSAEWARAFVVVHEMHHVAVDTGETVLIADTHYTKPLCELLALTEPSVAVMNAQNYAYYVMGEFWVRPTPAPVNAPMDLGLWHTPVVGGAWGESAGSPAAAGTDYVHKVVIVAWRDPDPKGGRLWHRLLRIEPTSETWTDMMLLSQTLPDGRKAPIESIGAPAIDISGQEFICAYVDRATKKLMCVATEESVAFSGIPTDYSNLIWNRVMEIAADPLADSDFKPAFVAYRDVKSIGNLSQGYYCVYRNTQNVLTCRVRLKDQSGGGYGNWINLQFDKYRKTYSNPALVEFDNQLKCVYWDERGHFVSLIYQPVIGGPIEYLPGADPVGHESKLGSWREDGHSIAGLTDSKMIALGVWSHGHTSLMAVRNKYSGAEATSLYYSNCGGGVWSPDMRMPTRNSRHCPALAACGSNSYLFFVDTLGRIEGVKSDLKRD